MAELVRMLRQLALVLLILVPRCGTVNAQSLVQRAANKAQAMDNPFGNDRNAWLAGAKLFRRECSACHGEAGGGNGRSRTPPLTTPMVKNADAGTLFWILRNGSENHAMPSFSHLPEPERWQIITYLKDLK